MTTLLPFEIREAIVNVFGRAFWLKEPLRAFALSCGVPAELYERFAQEPKFTIVLADTLW